MKTEFILLIINFPQFEVSSFNYTEVSVDFQRVISNSRNIHKVTVPQGYNLYNNNCTFVSPIYTFPWRET